MKSYKKLAPNIDYSAEYQTGFVRWFNANKERFAIPVEMSGVTNPPPECTRRDIRLTFPSLPRCLQIRMIIGPYRQFIVDAEVEWNGNQISLEGFSKLFVEDFDPWGYSYAVKSLEPICEPLLKWVNEELASATAIRLRSEGGHSRLGWSAILVHRTVAAQPIDLYDIPLTGHCVKYMLAKRHYPIGHELIVAVQGAKHIAVLTGAGVCAESGIPISQNSNTNLRDRFDASNFESNPAHLSIAQLAQHCHLTLMTQIADDLHAHAGCTNVLHLHESMTEHECQQAIAAAKACDVLLIVGASDVGQRVSQIPMVAAKAGAFIAQFAVQKADSLPTAYQHVYGPVETMFPLLVQAAFAQHT